MWPLFPSQPLEGNLINNKINRISMKIINFQVHTQLLNIFEVIKF
jgi:hypothetical protein